jgi:hypothetical protein
LLQGQCKPNAIELAQIAEAQPVLALLQRKGSNNAHLGQKYSAKRAFYSANFVNEPNN